MIKEVLAELKGKNRELPKKMRTNFAMCSDFLYLGRRTTVSLQVASCPLLLAQAAYSWSFLLGGSDVTPSPFAPGRLGLPSARRPLGATLAASLCSGRQGLQVGLRP